MKKTKEEEIERGLVPKPTVAIVIWTMPDYTEHFEEFDTHIAALDKYDELVNQSIQLYLTVVVQSNFNPF